MYKAYCTTKHCDPKQVSAKGKLKVNVLATQTICECGGLLIWRSIRAPDREIYKWGGRRGYQKNLNSKVKYTAV